MQANQAQFVRVHILLAFVLALTVSAHSVGDAEESSPASSVIRLIVTAQALYFQAHGRYATNLGDLSGPLELAAVQSSLNQQAYSELDRQLGNDPLPGFTIQWVVASDGLTYKLSIIQKSAPCAHGWFADDTGSVFEGKSVDCPTEDSASPLTEAASSLTFSPESKRSFPVASTRTWGPPDIDQVIPPVKTDTACPLKTILSETSKRGEELVDNLQRFSATEQIEHLDISKDGKPHNSQNRTYNYVAEIEPNPGGSLRVEEYREARMELPATPIADTGTAAFALIFHPRHIKNFNFRCEGLADHIGVPAWQLHFEESADPTKSFHAIRISGSVYQLRFKGRAWISTDTYEVLRLETDLVSPIPQINLQVEHLEIVYAPVGFSRRHLQLWLPQSATLYIGFRGHRYERIHTFSRFQLFSVDTDQAVKEPIEPDRGEIQGPAEGSRPQHGSDKKPKE